MHKYSEFVRNIWDVYLQDNTTHYTIHIHNTPVRVLLKHVYNFSEPQDIICSKVFFLTIQRTDTVSHECIPIRWQNMYLMGRLANPWWTHALYNVCIPTNLVTDRSGRCSADVKRWTESEHTPYYMNICVCVHMLWILFWHFNVKRDDKCCTVASIIPFWYWTVLQ